MEIDKHLFLTFLLQKSPQPCDVMSKIKTGRTPVTAAKEGGKWNA
jgi:hypothetical protein